VRKFGRGATAVVVVQHTLIQPFWYSYLCTTLEKVRSLGLSVGSSVASRNQDIFYCLTAPACRSDTLGVSGCVLVVDEDVLCLLCLHVS
jgi:hypothetical protein